VQGLGNQLLADAALALQKHRDVGLRDLASPVDDIFDGVGRPDNAKAFLNGGAIHRVENKQPRTALSEPAAGRPEQRALPLCHRPCITPAPPPEDPEPGKRGVEDAVTTKCMRPLIAVPRRVVGKRPPEEAVERPNARSIGRLGKRQRGLPLQLGLDEGVQRR
jgi:hypothetical protein